MAKIALFPPNYRLLNTVGELITDGGLIYTYAATTSTPIATYSDASGGTTLANPYVVPSTGLVDIWVTPGVSYRLVIKTAAGATLHDMDNLVGALKASDITTLGNIATGTITASGTISGTAVSMSGNVASGGVVSGASVAVTGAITGDTLTTTGATTATALNATVEDSRTNTVATPITVTATTSGTPAAGIGTGISFKAESADENPCTFGQVDFRATDVTAGSEDTECVVSTRVAGAAIAPAYKLRNTGAGNYIFTGAPTTSRTITLPDTDLTLTAVTNPYVFISSTIVSVPTSVVSFNNLSASYSKYVLVYHNVLPATDSQSLKFRVGTDNTTQKSGGSDYSQSNMTSGSAGLVGGYSAAGSDISVSTSGDNGAGNTQSGEITIINPMSTADKTTILFKAYGVHTSGAIDFFEGGGRYQTNGATDIIFLFFSSGNISTGSFYLYGVRTS